jgi:nucleoside-diphosphate-sugar epimerase
MHEGTVFTHAPARRRAKRRTTLLVTGATGVVGQALLARLAEMDVICLVHRKPLPERPGLTSVHADITQPHLGLSRSDYSTLAARTDAVVHCAAVTDFNRTDGSLEATNIGGTEQIVAFAEAADAHLCHVSTAFLETEAIGDRGHTAVRYAASKRRAEGLVSASSAPHVILRPSVVIGDSHTGRVASFQGFYFAARAILQGLVPLIPFNSEWPIDFVPGDVVADAIVSVLHHQITDGVFWITTGEGALTLGEAVTECVGFGREIGILVDPPRFVAPEVFDRLIGPVFIDMLPPRVRKNVLKLLEFFAVYLSRDSKFPSSLNGGGPLRSTPFPDPRASLMASLHYWAQATGRLPSPTETAVA